MGILVGGVLPGSPNPDPRARQDYKVATLGIRKKEKCAIRNGLRIFLLLF